MSEEPPDGSRDTAPIRRVLMSCDAVGGVWTYAMELVRELSRRRVETTLVVLGPKPDSGALHEARAISGVEVLVEGGRLEWMREPWEDVDRAGERLLAIERETAPDVVHLNGFSHGALPWRAPAVVVAHSCVLSWWRAVEGCDAPARYDEYRRRVAAGLAAAAVVAAPTRAMLASLVELHRAPPGIRIRNGIRRSIWGAVAKRPCFLAAGRTWDRAKGLDTLTRVAGRLPWPVRVAGDTDSPDGRASALEGVELLGRLPRRRLAIEMGRAAVLVHPARYEPFGLVPLEAAASGCALVLGDIASLRETWDGAAEFVPPGDEDALADSLVRLARDEDRRRELAASAFARSRALRAGLMANEVLAAYAVARAVERV